MDIFYSFSNLELMVLSCTMLMILYTILSLVLQRSPLSLDDRELDLVIDTQFRVFVICSLILGFSLAQVNQNLRGVDVQIQKEAIQLSHVDRLLLDSHVPNLSVGDARKLLIDYAKDVTTTEWQAMSDNVPIELNNPILTKLSQLIKVACKESEACKDLRKESGKLSDLRNDRIELSHLDLPHIFWGVILVLLAFAVTLSAIAAVNKFRLAVMGSQVFILGLLISVVYILDKPFKGESSVDPHAIERVIATMKATTE